jgi:lipoprotein NlpD
MARFLKWCGSLLLAACLTGCGTLPLSPVSEQGTNLRHPESVYREVLPGDTLYSISWESGRDYRDVARWNGIAPPYIIVPGQKLRLFPPASAERARAPTPKPSSPPPERSATAESSASGKKSSVVEPAMPASRRASARAARQLAWTWPTEGRLVERYSATGPNKGIDIAGRRGQPILAAAAGQVVYQGGGLRGYGQLIIIKHNADFLSAYAHCDKIYVKEGNVIKRGQKIADMGSSGANQTQLHFEIRYRGAPVDPQDYLPKK